MTDSSKLTALEVLPQPQDFGNDWLTHINPVVLPDAVGVWPQTLGWLLLLALVILALACGVWEWLRARRDDTYRRQALEKIRGLKAAYDNHDVQALQSVPALLRQVAFCHWPRQQLLPLTDQAWFDFLALTSCQPPPNELKTLAYLPLVQLQTVSRANGVAILAWSEQWIAEHRDYGQQVALP